VLVPTSFEFNPNTISTHVLNENELDCVLKNYSQDAKGRIEVTTIKTSNDFHVSNVNMTLP
jgi:hypothetical protein